jgi:hypothetical protein
MRAEQPRTEADVDMVPGQIHRRMLGQVAAREAQATQRANRLGDECGRLADENRTIRLELADALRKVARLERLERKRGGR